VVAKLGAGSNVLHESDIEATNWMSALRATRESMSERPSVPPGASCSIDAEGTATILDPGSRRKFVLQRIELASGGASADKPAVVVRAVPAPATAPAPVPPPAGVVAPAAAPASVGGPASLRSSANPTGTPGAAHSTQVQPRNEQQAESAKSETQPAETVEPSTSTKKKRFNTVAFTDGLPVPGPAKVVGEAARATQPRVTSIPARADSDSDSVRQSGKPRAELELLIERDEESTPQNPLCYRERAYLLVKGTTVPEAEAALRWKLAELQKTLAGRPRGCFVNLAVFDHRWRDVPERPPVIALEWRDWRGEVVVDYPAAARVSSLPAPSRPHDDHLPEVFEALGELARLHTPAEGLDFAVRLLGRVIPSEAISACLYDINTDELRFVALSGTAASSMQGQAVPRGAGLFGQAVRTENQSSIFADVMVEPSFNPQVDSRPGLDARNVLLRPLAHERQLLGMLQLINRSGAGAFSSEDVNAINYVAERLAEFLHGARMQRRVQS
jgi:GAF domain